MRKNQPKKNTTNKTMHKRQSKEKTIEYHKKKTELDKGEGSQNVYFYFILLIYL